jgi:succinate dehydrogenase/fumarate reductase cytochrome b subunit
MSNPAIDENVTDQSQSLSAALVRELSENIRLAVNKFAQGILIYLAIEGFSFNFAFRPEIETRTKRLTAFANLVFSVALIVYGWLAAGFVRHSLAGLRSLVEDNQKLASALPQEKWLVWGAALLTVSASMGIVIWVVILFS